MRWSTLGQRVFALTVLDDFLAARGISEPRLDGDPARARQLMRDFLGHVRAGRTSRGPTKGQPVSPAQFLGAAVVNMKTDSPANLSYAQLPSHASALLPAACDRLLRGALSLQRVRLSRAPAAGSRIRWPSLGVGPSVYIL